MPLKKCFSSPHLSQLVKAAEKESCSPRPKAKHRAGGLPAPRPKVNGEGNAHQKGKNGGNGNGAGGSVGTLNGGKLKKCFSSPHLKDLNSIPVGDAAASGQYSSGRKRHDGSNTFRNEVINCRFRSCGCTVRLSRERMDSHLRTNAATHSLLILNKIDDIGRKNEQIFKRLVTVEKSIQSMNQLFENLQDVLTRKGIPTVKQEGRLGFGSTANAASMGILSSNNSSIEVGGGFDLLPRVKSEHLAASMQRLLAQQEAVAKEVKMLPHSSSLKGFASSDILGSAGAPHRRNNISSSINNNNKRVMMMPEHLDLAVGNGRSTQHHPNKRQRKELSSLPMNGIATATSAMSSSSTLGGSAGFHHPAAKASSAASLSSTAQQHHFQNVYGMSNSGSASAMALARSLQHNSHLQQQQQQQQQQQLGFGLIS